LGGHKELTLFLMQKGASVTCSDLSGNSPLYVAVQTGNVAIVQMLLSAGADTQAVNVSGATPLHGAAVCGSAKICKMLIYIPKLVTSLRHADSSIKRVVTGICCIRRYAKLPRELIFMIFTDDGLINDFAIMLLLASYNPATRAPTTSITNTSAWRLLIKAASTSSTDTGVLVPGDTMVLESKPEELICLEASVYGDTWKMVQLQPLDFTKELHEKAQQNQGADIDIVIDGGKGTFKQFTRPFRVSCRACNVAEYAPISLVPKSMLIRDAFPCVVYKGSKDSKQPLDARLLFKLPSDYSSEMAQRAYERIKRLWEKEKHIYSAHSEYVECVLEILDNAYECLKNDNCQFSTELLDSEIIPDTFVKQQAASVWLKSRFFNKKMLTFDEMLYFFKELYVEQQASYMLMEDNEGRTAYDHAPKWLAQLLNPDNYEQNFGEALRIRLERTLYLKRRSKAEHHQDESLPWLAIKRLGLEQPVNALNHKRLTLQQKVWWALPRDVQLLCRLGKYTAIGPVVGAKMVVEWVGEAKTKKEMLKRAATLPVTVPAAMVVSIPVSLFWVFMTEIMRDSL